MEHSVLATIGTACGFRGSLLAKARDAAGSTTDAEETLVIILGLAISKDRA